MKKFLTFVSAAAACVISLHAQTDRQSCHTVSEMTLLKELADRDEMARFPMPEYRTAQFSSYDRASVAKDQPGWYANGDWSAFIRAEEVEGHTEYVMMEDFLKPSLTSSIEGEDMRVESCDAQYHIQYLGHPQWSYKTILFMNKAHKGDRITASFDSPYEAIVRADAILAMAGDYGKVNLYFNGEKVIACEDLKFYEISSKAVPMGEILLKKGKNTVVIEIEDTPDGLDEGVAGIDKMIFYPL